MTTLDLLLDKFEPWLRNALERLPLLTAGLVVFFVFLLLARLYGALVEAGVNFPYLIRTVQLQYETGGDGAAGARARQQVPRW